jgi:hypothetical protein
MSKKRGLSLDDKRQAILSIYHEQQQPFNLKEIELLGSKSVNLLLFSILKVLEFYLIHNF